MKVKLSVDFDFSAAHQLPLHPGVCRRMHGHNYKLQVWLTGQVGDDGMIRDFEDVKKKVWDRALGQCDHHCLNDFIKNPTAELVAQWFWEKLEPAIEGLVEVRLWERPDYCVCVTA